jgi:hypothetical protein
VTEAYLLVLTDPYSIGVQKISLVPAYLVDVLDVKGEIPIYGRLDRL